MRRDGMVVNAVFNCPTSGIIINREARLNCLTITSHESGPDNTKL